MAEETTAGEQGGKPGARKRHLALAALALVLLAVGGAGWFLGLFGAGLEAASVPTASMEAPMAAQRQEPVVFVDMPDVLVNLHTLGQRTRFLKLKMALEVESEAVAGEVMTLMPRVMDSFQAYLRALTVDEVSGAGSLQRLKEELTARVNLALAPIRVGDVLVKEMLVQ